MRRRLCLALLALFCCSRLWRFYSRVRASVIGPPHPADLPSWNVVPIVPNMRSGASGRAAGHDSIGPVSIFGGGR